jgi:hypothetical protein
MEIGNHFFESPDKGFGGGAEKKVDVEQKIKERRNDINEVLAPVPSQIRNNAEEYAMYRDRINEAKKRLLDEGINLDEFTRKGVQVGTKEGNEIYGKRKGELRGVIGKVVRGEVLTEDEQRIIETIKIKKEEPLVEEKPKEEEKQQITDVVEKPWERAIKIFENIKDPAERRKQRYDWIARHLEDMEVPYSVMNEQSEKLNQDVTVPLKEKKKETTVKKDDIPSGSKEKIIGGAVKKDKTFETTKDKKEEKKVEVFTKEEEDLIIKECYDLVFVRMKNGTDDVKKSLFDISGVIASTLGRGKDPVISDELTKKIENLGIESWVNMRNVVSQWDRFKEVKEIDASTLNLNMFMYPSSEAFFAHSKGIIPIEDANGKFIETKEVDLEKEISMAMRAIRNHFANELKDDFGNPALVEYWRLVGDQSERTKLYKLLNLNKYVGETAYALLLSYQMLTDSSAEDFMSMMVDQVDTRVKKYKISEERDSFVRMLIQEDLANGKKPFTLAPPEEHFRKREETKSRLASLIPAHLIPTGLTGDGAVHLERGDWLKWRVDVNFYSRNDLDNAKIEYNKVKQSGVPVSDSELLELKNKIKPATDPGTRMDMMRSALTVLNLTKEIATDASDLTKYESLKGRLYAHMTGSFGDAKWLGDKGMVPKDFTFNEVENGRIIPPVAMPINEWISRTMMGVGKAFLYTHSMVDDECSKPWDMKSFAINAEQLFRNEIQSTKATFVGQQKEKMREHQKDMLKFIDKLWNYSYDLIDILNNKRKSPSDFPMWYQRRVSASQAVIEVAKKAYADIGEWDKRKRESKLKD